MRSFSFFRNINIRLNTAQSSHSLTISCFLASVHNVFILYRYQMEKDIATYIKREFDIRFNRAWRVFF